MAILVRWASAALKLLDLGRRDPLKIAVIGFAGAGKKTLCGRLNATEWSSVPATFEAADVDFTDVSAHVRASVVTALHTVSTHGADGMILLVDGTSVYDEDTAALKDLFAAAVTMRYVTLVLANKADKVNENLFSKMHEALGAENPHDLDNVKFGTCVAINDPTDDDVVLAVEDLLWRSCTD